MKLEDLKESEQTHPFIAQLQSNFKDDDVAWSEHNKHTVVFAADDGVSDTDEKDAELAGLGFTVDKDYKWSIAMGDDEPHAVLIYNAQMLDDQTVRRWLYDIAGPGTY